QQPLVGLDRGLAAGSPAPLGSGGEVVACAVSGPGRPAIVAGGAHAHKGIIGAGPIPADQVIGAVGRAGQWVATGQGIGPAAEREAVGGVAVGQLVAADRVALQAPAQADPGGLLLEALAAIAVVGGAGVAERQAGLDAGRAGGHLDRVGKG